MAALFILTFHYYDDAPTKVQIMEPLMNDESKRLDVLYSYEILDTPEEATFNSIAQLAATLC